MGKDSAERAMSANPMIDHTIREGFLHAPIHVGAGVEVERRTPPREAPRAQPAAPQAQERVSSPGGGGREVRRSTKVPVVFASDRPAAALEGSTLVADPQLLETGGAKQRSKRLVRVIVPARVDGPSEMVFEVRALVLTNGRDVLRYSAYRDPDTSVGFAPGGRSRVEITLREVQILPARPARAAEAHLRYDGVLEILGQRAVFSGMLFIDGEGKVRATEPDVTGAGARGRLHEGKAEIGWF